jgi:nucleotide-binding universal stress UspA family protein
MFQRLLICTDFLDGLNRLVNFVDDLAIAGIKQIVFLHVVPLSDSGAISRPDEEKIARAQKQLSVALTQIPAGVEVKVEVQSGQAVDTILRVAKTYGTEVIMLGTQSRTLLTEKILGSTLADLSRRTTIPLLVLRPQLISTYRVKELQLRCRHLFQYLLLPYDGSHPAQYMIKRMQQYGQNSSNLVVERCLVCWVVRDGGRRELPENYLVEQAQAALIPVKAELEKLNMQVAVAVRQGEPIHEILAVAEAEDISAIALSADTLSQRLEWFISSFAGELLRRSWHPILFFPPNEEKRGS